MDCNNIGVEGAKAIAKALETNTSLTYLNVQTNCIGVEGAKAIAIVNLLEYGAKWYRMKNKNDYKIVQYRFKNKGN